MGLVYQDFVVVFYCQGTQFALFAVFEFGFEAFWEVEACAQEDLCVFVEAVAIGNPFQSIDSAFEQFLYGSATDGIGIRPGKRFNFILLQIAIDIVKGLRSTRTGRRGDIIEILKLPVGPGPEILAHLIGQHSDLPRTLLTIRECPILGHESPNAHFLCIQLLAGDLELIEDGTEFGAYWLAELCYVGAVDVVAEDLTGFLGLRADGLVEAACQHIDYAWLIEDQVHRVILSDAFIDLLVCGQQELVVTLPWQQSISRTTIEISPNGLIQNLIAQQIRLLADIRSNPLPHLSKMIQQTSLIGKEIFLESHHVLTGIEKSELDTQAFRSVRVPMLIVVHFNVDGEGEVRAFDCPVWKPLPAELSIEEVLVSVQDDVDAILIALLDHFPQFLYVSVIIHSLLRLDALPGNMQPNNIKAPAPQILQVHISKRVIGIKVVQFGIEREQFLDGVDSVEDRVAAVLVQEQGCVRVYGDAGNGDQQDCEDQQLFYHCYQLNNRYLMKQRRQFYSRRQKKKLSSTQSPQQKNTKEFKDRRIKSHSQFKLKLQAPVILFFRVDELEAQAVGARRSKAGDKIGEGELDGVSGIVTVGELRGLLVQECAIKLHGQLGTLESYSSLGSPGLRNKQSTMTKLSLMFLLGV